MRITLLLILLSFGINAQKTKAFTGKLTYRYEFQDTVLQKMNKPGFEVLYTNDTIVRIENETIHLGQQVMIKHLELRKSFLLIRTSFGDFAVKTSVGSIIE